MEHLLTGDWYSAQEAERVGLVNHVVPNEELEEAVEKMTAKLINKSPVGSAIIKDLVRRGMNTDLTTGLNLELAGVVYASLTEDFAEGMSAFEQKRKPRYKGK
jgi:enoyl-CoA hydratase/carnithine racemase